jgi:hypothetical protein
VEGSLGGELRRISICWTPLPKSEIPGAVALRGSIVPGGGGPGRPAVSNCPRSGGVYRSGDSTYCPRATLGSCR